MKFHKLSFVVVVSLLMPCFGQEQTVDRANMSAVIGKQLELAGDNRVQLQAATEWQKSVPDADFFNDVLPYAGMDESRDAWRVEFREKFWPLVKGCKSGSEVAQKLNETVFKTITWEMTDPVVDDFFWLSVDEPGKGKSVDARILHGSDNVPVIDLETVHLDQLTVWLDERLIGDAKEVDIKLNGQVARHRMAPSIKNLCDSLLCRADPNLAFQCRLDLKIPKQE